MVTEELKPLFEREGISLIPLADGATLVAQDMQRPDTLPAEIVVLAQPVQAETRWSGEADPSRVGQAFQPDVPHVGQAFQPDVPDLGQAFQPDVRLESLTYNKQEPAVSRGQSGTRTPRTGEHALGKRLETAFQRQVSLETLPVLASHVIDGHAVLPMILILEWLAEGAVRRNPGLVVVGVDDMKLYKGVILYGPPAVTVEIRAGKAVRDGREFRITVEMCGTLAGGREVALARADVVLAERHPSGAPRIFHRTADGYPHTRDEIYRSLLFHGPAMRGIERVDACNRHGISGWARVAPSPAEWIARPTRGTWIFDPLAIDCAFQLVVLWCRSHFGSNSLPTLVRGLRQYQSRFPAEGVRILVEIREATETRAVADVEFLDADEGLIARLDGYECVIDRSLNEAFCRNTLASPAAAENWKLAAQEPSADPKTAFHPRSRKNVSSVQ